jgi:hypothetical protein
LADPNVKFDTEAMQVVALRDISADSELQFFYPSSEWEMAAPFQCWCGSPKVCFFILKIKQNK